MLALDKASGDDRLVGAYSLVAGWDFGCREQDALNGHEALTYRDKNIDRRRHEHAAMVAQLLKKLGAKGAVTAEELAELPLPVEGVREQMMPKSRELLAVKHALEVTAEGKGASVAIEELQVRHQVELHAMIAAKDEENAQLKQVLDAKDAKIAALEAKYEQ